MPDEKIMTMAEWASLSAESRHRINLFGVEHEELKARFEALEAHLSNVRIGLGNIGDVPDSELGWQVKMLNLRYQRLLDAEKS
ncbi:MAG: hypothetical protein ABSE06_01370 [Anaerolineaceae bacterium]|jgi:hypothetical protein